MQESDGNTKGDWGIIRVYTPYQKVFEGKRIRVKNVMKILKRFRNRVGDGNPFNG